MFDIISALSLSILRSKLGAKMKPRIKHRSPGRMAQKVVKGCLQGAMLEPFCLNCATCLMVFWKLFSPYIIRWLSSSSLASRTSFSSFVGPLVRYIFSCFLFLAAPFLMRSLLSCPLSLCFKRAVSARWPVLGRMPLLDNMSIQYTILSYIAYAI